MTLPVMLFLSIGLDRLIGDPDWIYSKTPHPVTIMAKLLMRCEKMFNDFRQSSTQKKGIGGIVFFLYLGCFVGLAATVEYYIFKLLPIYAAVFAMALLSSSLLAMKSLVEHVRNVHRPLLESNIEQAREQVSKIVGRDTKALQQEGIIKAAIESLAENFSDGFIAPVFWFALFGFPGLVFYKAVNTADSLIGHKNERFRDYGYFAAKTDDVVNWIPARLTGIIIILAVAFDDFQKAVNGFFTMTRDARKHASPNAGWPEAAMAGVLNIQLGGARSYDGQKVDGAVFGDSLKSVEPSDIIRALKLINRAWLLILSLVGIFAVLSAFQK